MRIGLITYDCEHLKTEQLVFSYIKNPIVTSVNLYALPFTRRTKRDVIIHHRPDMTDSILTKSLAELPKVEFQKWNGKDDISKYNDIFVIGGAGILEIGFAKGKPIVNAHPGIIPTTRGLDSFKWAIFNDDPIGNTLHLIDEEVDQGQILHIEKTHVLSSDNINTLARRHYENEILLLGQVLNVIENRVTITQESRPSKMRMGIDTEKIVIKKFEKWKIKMLSF